MLLRTAHDLGRFPDDSLFHRIGRVVCGAGWLPRKELFEAWEVARRVRRRFRGGRVVDVCGGHGLLGQIMLLLDDSLFRLWREQKCTKQDVLAKAQSPDELAARIANAERGMFDEDDDKDKKDDEGGMKKK